MGLSNASSRARNYNLTANRNQGGGNKKAGFPYQIGRTHWTPIFLQTNNYSRRCCSLRGLQLTANPNVRQHRPAGSSVTTSYWH